MNTQFGSGAALFGTRSQPALPGTPERRAHDYVRHGTTSLFAALNVADDTVISQAHRRPQAVES